MPVVAVVILVVLGLPLLAFVVWQLLQEALVHVDSGSAGVLVVRGKATEKILTPGVHFVWPFRQQMIQGYPLRELTYLTADHGDADETDYVDPPMPARLGDRAPVLVLYTIRFRIRPDGLRELHERVGPDGLKRLVRDQSRRVIIAELASDAYSLADAFGSARDQLETALSARVTEVLLQEGFDVTMFNLRNLDLGAVNDVIEATLRTKEGLELERAAAEVRRLRIENESETADQLASSLSDAVLRYRQIELGRDALQRWDGRIVVGDSLIRRAVPTSEPTDEAPPPDEVAPTEQTATTVDATPGAAGDTSSSQGVAP
jgi:regulator of protease activity HflC (stomatin/prohibitin superfamily)